MQHESHSPPSVFELEKKFQNLQISFSRCIWWRAATWQAPRWSRRIDRSDDGSDWVGRLRVSLELIWRCAMANPFRVLKLIFDYETFSLDIERSGYPARQRPCALQKARFEADHANEPEGWGSLPKSNQLWSVHNVHCFCWVGSKTRWPHWPNSSSMKVDLPCGPCGHFDFFLFPKDRQARA